jgi:hypothetical protein
MSGNGPPKKPAADKSFIATRPDTSTIIQRLKKPVRIFFMKPNDDPWLKSAHTNAESLDREIKNLIILTAPIRENLPIITKYQDFWNQAKRITGLFRDLKPLARSDRDLLWTQFNAVCRDVKEKQKVGYGALESLSQGHFDEIMQLVERSQLPPGAAAPVTQELVEHGKALKNASDLLAKFKTGMIAKHKKACFDRIQEVRKTHDAAWELVKTETPDKESEMQSRIRKNLEANYERREKGQNALENFQIGRDHICTFLATSKDPDKIVTAKARLAETEARIKDIEQGIRQLEKWIAEDERRLKGI